MITLKKYRQDATCNHRVFLVEDAGRLAGAGLTGQELAYVEGRFTNEQRTVEINRFTGKLLVTSVPPGKEADARLEAWRRKGNEAAQWAKEEKAASLEIVSLTGQSGDSLAFCEGTILGSYQFLKYNTKASKSRSALTEILVSDDLVNEQQLSLLSVLSEAVWKARDLVNEPVLSLNAAGLGEVFREMGGEAGFSCTILGKEEVTALGMGGLLAVNQGSIDPPVFAVMEWKPEKPLNSQPVVLVGKGIVFDTGGLSLKPTPKSMDYMKSDMAGGAAVAAALYAAAKNGLPLHLVALVPATDNRPGGNAITPGDVITISNGATVEVLNTDAEGRLILADALCYAKKYDPMLVIDLATLTGSAAMTLSSHGIAAMGTASADLFGMLKDASARVHERIVELPLWEEYDEMLKSTIADMKNIGGGEAGAITAGKFLQRFTDYPWIHLDIAGPAFLHAADHYRVAGGTAVGVRLLTSFFTHLADSLATGANS